MIIVAVTNSKEQLDYNDIRYYRPEHDKFNAVSKI